jgi:FAD/FMN-containing dehydrogenase
MRLFNRVYYLANGVGAGTSIVHPQPFFYPLDAIRDWNRVYGRRGFTQYQCVLPYNAGATAYRQLLEIARRADASPYLVVVKDFGETGAGTLSFPRPGVTFTIDFPVRPGRTQRLVDALNDSVAGHGGSVYLAKDAFTRAEHFSAMEPRLSEFAAVRERWDPERVIRSAQSVRLFGDSA